MGAKESQSLAQLMGLLESRYAMRVLWALRDGHPQTFRLLQDSVGGITPNTLNTRIKELREARKWSLAELADRIGDGTTASAVHKLETGATKLTTEWMERIGAALAIDPIEIIDDRIGSGLAEDVARYDVPAHAPRIDVKAGNIAMLVTSNALDEVGILNGDIIEVTEAADAIKAVATGDIVVADVPNAHGNIVTTVLREFIEPSLLITNSRAENAPPINIRTARATITGMVVRSHRTFGRKKS